MFVDFDVIVASRLSEAGLKTLLIEGGNQSYGITGGDLDARRPVSFCLSTDIDEEFSNR